MLDGGQFTIIPEACNVVSAVVEPASRMAQMSPAFKEKSAHPDGFSLSVAVAGAIPASVLIDHSRVAQILTNLLDNAGALLRRIRPTYPRPCLAEWKMRRMSVDELTSASASPQ